MIREKLIFKVPIEVAPPVDPTTWAGIFGTNLYEWWDMSDNATISNTGALADSILSKGSNAGLFTSSGADRPNIVADPILGRQVFDFDGVSEKMSVPSSTGMYNFLHDGSGGCVIVVYNVNSLTGAGILINNAVGIGDVGWRMQHLSTGNSANLRASNNSSLICNSTSSNASVLNNYNSYIQVFDLANATAADKGEVILNGVSTKNNVETGSPSLSNAVYDLMIGGRSDGNSGLSLNGSISEIIIVDTIPTPIQLADIQTKLTTDYGTFPIS